MATRLFHGYDGTGRLPREIQKQALDWIEANLSKDILAMNLSTGAGKSFIAKTLADKLGAHVITPANALVDQYVETYPAHNALKGKSHYSCSSGLSCQDWSVTLKQKPCPNCPYVSAKARALEEPTFFNPMSLYYLTLHPEWKPPRTLIVDECFPGSQYVKTDRGNLTLRDIHKRIEKGENLHAYSFNEETQNFEYKKIIQSWEHPSEKSSVKVCLGFKNFICTEDHKVLSHRGWVSAGSLSPGDGIIGDFNSKPIFGLSADQLQLFYGSYLGDGSVDWRDAQNTTARLKIVHGGEQLDYLKWKLEIFHISKLRKGKSGYGHKSIYNGQTKCFFDSRLGWADLIKNIDARGLAIWFMDDGTLTTKGDIVIHTNAFSEQEVTDLHLMLKQRFNVDLSIRKTNRGYFYLTGNRENSSKFLDIVEPFIPGCMAKKSRNPEIYKEWRALDTVNTQFHVVSKIEKTVTPDLVYDIEVEGNHNFLAVFNKYTKSGVVAHNCHSLSSMLLMLCGLKLPFSRWRYPKHADSELVLVPFLEGLHKKLVQLVAIHSKAGNSSELKEAAALAEQTKLALEGVREDAQNYAIYETEGTLYRKKEKFLHISPLRPPRFIVEQLLDSRRLILMSGTLFRPDIEDLVGDRHYEFLDLPSPIPVENRRIYYKPAPFPMNFKTDPRDIVRVIETIIDHNPGVNTLVHVTYSMSEKLRRYFRKPVLYNTAANKDKVIADFKRNGGIFLAAGCSEGLDLPDDLCRLNIIPKLPFPDLSDKTVQKRKALADGDDWYNLTTFKTLIQQCGRSTRNEKDFSKTYILDPNFSRLYKSVSSKLPKYFTEAVVWGGG